MAQSADLLNLNDPPSLQILHWTEFWSILTLAESARLYYS